MHETPHDTAPRQRSAEGLRSTNTSGFPGVSWHKGAQKWGAYIRRDGKRTFLGLFPTAEAAYQAYGEADKQLRRPEPTREDELASLVQDGRLEYQRHGFDGLRRRNLQRSGLFSRMLRLGVTHAGLIDALGLTDVRAQSRAQRFRYRGIEKPRWNWEQVIVDARELLTEEGDLPTIPWCRRNGHSHLVNVVFQTDHTWEELRQALGLKPSQRYFASRSGRRWRSRPEACLSNFLHARGVEHKRGEPYPAGYAEMSGRTRAQYDMHFKVADGRWIDVEVWGNLSGDHFGGSKYADTRRAKEAWNSANPNFLGIDHEKCLSDSTLAPILEPYIGDIRLAVGTTPIERIIETAHWSSADELIESCRQLAKDAPGGVFPSDEWLRKRGKFSDRAGPAYNSMSAYVHRWLGGTRKVRQLLNQEQASTTKWDEAKVKSAWMAFEKKHGLSPGAAVQPANRTRLAKDVAAECIRIWTAAGRLDVRDAELGIRQGRKVLWTPERIAAEWKAFHKEFGCHPTECMGVTKRKMLPPQICARATNIYSAARRLGLVDQCRNNLVYFLSKTVKRANTKEC